MSRRREWAVAFARQAWADFQTYKVLEIHPEIAACQRLHFLQMTCEKLCKAQLFLLGSEPGDLDSSHAHVAKVLPTLYRVHLAESKGVALRSRWTTLKSIRHIAREIELLAPSVRDGGRRPDYCEYPWEDPSGGGVIKTPAEHDFVSLDLLDSPTGRTLIKVIGAAIEAVLSQ